jgi:hypothetical protein
MNPATPDLLEHLQVSGSDELVDGLDLYTDPEPMDGRYQEESDTITQAVGSPGYMTNYALGECVQHHGTDQVAVKDPERFDRYYFAPDHEEQGLTPILIDVLTGNTQEERARERAEKSIDFKTAWCAGRGIRYAVLHEEDDLMGSLETVRARMRGETTETKIPSAVVQEPAPAASGIQHPRGD